MAIIVKFLVTKSLLVKMVEKNCGFITSSKMAKLLLKYQNKVTHKKSFSFNNKEIFYWLENQMSYSISV